MVEEPRHAGRAAHDHRAKSGCARQGQRQREQGCFLYQDIVPGLTLSVVPTGMYVQTLYMACKRLCAIKVDTIDIPTVRILLVRDCRQDLYTGSDDTDSLHAIPHAGALRRVWAERSIGRALELPVSHFGDVDRIDHVPAVCKSRLLDRRFADWVSAHERRRGATNGLFQPDATNRNLLR